MLEIVRKHVLEVRYHPDAKILDNRGNIATSIVGEDFDGWNITNNRINFSNKDTPHIIAFFSYRNFGVSTNPPVTTADFKNISKNFIKNAWQHFDHRTLSRIGIRSSSIIKTNNFTETFEKVKNFFLKPSTDEMKKLGGDLIDAGFPLTFLDGENYFNATVGPMKKEEIQENFGKETTFDSGIYIEIDYFRSEFSPHIIAKHASEYMGKGIQKIKDFEEQIQNWLKL